MDLYLVLNRNLSNPIRGGQQISNPHIVRTIDFIKNFASSFIHKFEVLLSVSGYSARSFIRLPITHDS